jgi:hypothetical protein
VSSLEEVERGHLSLIPNFLSQYFSTNVLQISAKEKLRNYVFSKVDDDDPLDISPAKGGNQRSDESFYSQW